MPINEDEKKNDPAVKGVSDLSIDIYDVGEKKDDIKQEMDEKVSEFLGWYENEREENGWKSLTQN